jgi:hypothetical protein
MKLIRAITLIAFFSTSLLTIAPTAHAQDSHPSECSSATVGPLELDSVGGPLIYSKLVYLYRRATLTFTELAGAMTPGVIDTPTGVIHSPGSASSYTFVVPADGFYTIQVTPSLGYTKFSVRCDETPLGKACRLLSVSARTIANTYTITGFFSIGEMIFIDTLLPFKLVVNNAPYTLSEVTLVNFIVPANGNYRLVVQSTRSGSNFANYIRCEHV